MFGPVHIPSLDGATEWLNPEPLGPADLRGHVGRAIAARPISEGLDSDRFHADIGEVVHTHLNQEATMLVVEWWTPTNGLQRIERE
jgi:hypothetical protein